ncbi:hypothetical protein GF377_09245 [candidate division GN15 bacterium]|nr:hypothetical protein [candidate division GN15 bacterium]
MALSHFSELPPRVIEALLRRFGDPERILQATLDELQEGGEFPEEIIDRVLGAEDRLDEADAYLSGMARRDIQVTSRLDCEYPQLLFELNDPPSLLYVRGSLPENAKKSVGLVGSRKATNAGMELTAEAAREFAQADVQVVSSMHGGIDAAAHLACRTAGGKSFAVLDAGFDELDGEAAMPMAIDIVQQGGVISEYAPDVKGVEEHRGEANRLVVGLSQAVVVTEVYAGSEGSLDLLQFCRDIGKLVFLMVDPTSGAHVDETSLRKALDAGAIPLEGLDKVQDIVRALV